MSIDVGGYIAPNHVSGVLGSSFHAMLLACPQRAVFFLKSLKEGTDTSRTSSKVPALDRGSGIHLMLQHYYVHKKAQETGATTDWLPPVDALLEAQEQGQLGAGFKWDRQLAQSFMSAYRERWVKLEEAYTVEVVEDGVCIEVPVPDMFRGASIKHMSKYDEAKVWGDTVPFNDAPRWWHELAPKQRGSNLYWEYRPTVDLVLRHRNTKLLVGMDHKTTSEITSDSAAQYKNHHQFIGLKAAKYDIVQVNLVQLGGKSLSGVRLLPEHKFARPDIVVASAQLERWRHTVSVRRAELWDCITHGQQPTAVMSETTCYMGKYGKGDRADCSFYQQCCR